MYRSAADCAPCETIMPRPCKLTDESAARFVEAVGLGATYELAARYAGFDDSTFRRYMSDDRPEFQAFRAAVWQAEAEGVQALLARIHTAAATDWRAAAWILERRHPDDYGRVTRTQVSGPDGGPVPVGCVVIVPGTAASAEEWAANVQTQLRDPDDDD